MPMQISLRRAAAVAFLASLLSAGGWAEGRQGKCSPVDPRRPRGEPAVVNINAASDRQLRLLPGIGPSKARAIIRYRERRKFRATWELIRVKGIGRKTYRRLRPYLAVKGPTTLTARPPPRERKPTR
jgi:competence protein ComEA